MKKTLLTTICILSFSSASFANKSRTFSCSSIYEEEKTGDPFTTVHSEATFEEELEGLQLSLQGEDSKVKLTGWLRIKNAQEFLEIRIEFKDSYHLR